MDLRISTLLNAYRHGVTTPRAVIERILAEMDRAPAQIWITRLSRSSLEKYLEPLEKCDGIPADKPLFGIPFAIKDNIDLERSISTSACPAYAYKATKSSFVVKRLIEAGAIPLGKTNMDQFATGLVGVRSPYGSIGIHLGRKQQRIGCGTRVRPLQLFPRHRYGGLGTRPGGLQ